MTPEQFEHLNNSITTTIEKVVNGKINRLDEKLTSYIGLDISWKKDDAEWKKSVDNWRSTADPYIKLAQNISGTWKFLIYVIVGLLSLLGFYNIIQK